MYTNSQIEKIKEFVKNECYKPSSKYGSSPFTHHFTNVVKTCEILGEKLDANLEILIPAAWLHDIGAIMVGRENHHITSSKIAEDKLMELNYPKNQIEKIKECILSHRGSQKIKPKTKEAKILVDADAIDSFNDLSGLFECAYTFEKLSRDEAKKSVKNKLKNKFSQLTFEESKEIVKPKYAAAMLLLE